MRAEHLKILSALFLTLNWMNPSFGEVNLRLGSFEYEIDLSEFDSTTESDSWDSDLLKIRYNSRSQFLGIFGFGWCSAFDLRMERRGDDYFIYKCNKLIYHHVNKHLTRSTTFPNGVGEVVSYPHEVVFTSSSGILYSFDLAGLLSRVVSKSGVNYRLKEGSKNGNNGKVIQFNQAGYVIKLGEIIFTTGEGSYLESIVSKGRNIIMEYDPLGNLTSLVLDKKAMFKNSYELLGDRIVAYERVNFCKHNFKYNQKVNKAHYILEVLHSNSCQPLVEQKIQFQSNRIVSGVFKLQKVEVIQVNSTKH